MEAIAVELFTHPMCSGCPQALQALSQLAASGVIQLEVCTLGSPTGRRRAETLGVTCVPTIRYDNVLHVVKGRADLEKVVDSLAATATT